MPCFKIEFYGLVQGVGFRALIKRGANTYNLKGEVWNDPGDVNKVVAFVEGTYENIFNFLTYIFSKQEQGGPLIEHMKIYSTNCSYKDFRITYR